MQRPLIFLGIAILAIGLAWPWISRLPIGRLPGDIFIDRPNVKMYIPLTTMLLVSLLLSLIAWLFRR